MMANMENDQDDADDRRFWLVLSELSLAAIWDNKEDDIYSELLSRDE
ncbi:MAG TPA: hypothetical protein VKH44_15120 [Pirellulaceae bacterium]|nr:hypothetical protein [Pirellulaceae bacterium]